MQISIKSYSSCHFSHGFIDCAITLRDEGLRADDILDIECFVDEVRLILSLIL